MAYKRNKYKRKVLYLIRKLLSDKKLNDFLSYKNLGYIPDLNNPTTFNENIQWIKLYGNIEELGFYIDKYQVRKYVKKKIGNEALIPLLKVFFNKTEINFDNLPNHFIMKGAHGSGWNYVVEDLEKEKITNLTSIAKSWLDKNYYEETGERNYKLIKPKIVIEEILGLKNQELDEYKVHCFEGKPKFYEYISYENGKRKRNYYTVDWEQIPVHSSYPNFDRIINKPKNFDQIKLYAEKLSEEFRYVRVDLYNVRGKIYFGELTFTPAGGLTPFSDFKYDEEMGSHFNLKNDILINRKIQN